MALRSPSEPTAHNRSFGRVPEEIRWKHWPVRRDFLSFLIYKDAGRMLAAGKYYRDYCQRTTASGNCHSTSNGDGRSWFGNRICRSAIKCYVSTQRCWMTITTASFLRNLVFRRGHQLKTQP